MAAREIRAAPRRLLLLSASIAIGVAALVAILAHVGPDPITTFRHAIVLVIGFFAAAGLVAAILLTAKAAAPPAPTAAPATRPAERAQ